MIVDLDYSFRIEFSEAVSSHYFTLRVVPKNTPYYDILSLDISHNLFHTVDGFGNTVSFGNIKVAHDIFEINTKASVKFIDKYFDIDNSISHSLYLSQSQFTKYSHLFLLYIKKFKHSLNIKSFVAYVANMIFNDFEYERGITTTECTIDTLLSHKKGVCQDFAHLMVTILRYFGIPARYVSGFVSGEGESHAWVEYFDGYYWLGADPTHNVCIVDEPYIKIAHGRDAYDTSINRGVFIGQAYQMLSVVSNVEQ